MKLKRFLGFMSLAAVLLTFTACSDDDDDNVRLSSYVVGTYTGQLEMKFAYGTQEYENKTFTITANASNADLIDIAFSDEELGTLSGAKGITVNPATNANYPDGYTFYYEGIDCVLAMPTHGGGMSDYACVVSGTTSGDHKKFEIVLEMPGVMGGTTYTLTPAN